MNAPPTTTPQSTHEPMGSPGGAASAWAKAVVIAAGVVILLICTAIVLEVSGRVHPERDWVLGERPFTGLDVLLCAIIVVGAAVFLVLVAACLFIRPWKHALVLVAMFLIAPFLALPVSGLIASSSPGSSGFAAWTKSVDTSAVNNWLASNPAIGAPSSTAWAPRYAQDKSPLSLASNIPVTSVPRYDKGRLPDEVLLMPGKDAIFAIYPTGWRRDSIVIIGPAATTVPAQFHDLCTWTTIRPDFVVGDFCRP